MEESMDIKQKLIDETKFWYDYANEKLHRNFDYPEILFDLKGFTAGQAFSSLNKIRFNFGIAKDNLDVFLDTTVPHEVAHIVADMYFGKRCKHGKEWKWMMSQVFGKKAERCHSYDVSNHQARRTKKYVYRCYCEKGCLCGAKHHNLIQKNSLAILSCRKCKMRLLPESLLKVIDKVPAL
jgi:SprT protein